MFPTMFRGTLYGLAAASGKDGAMIIRPIVSIVANESNHRGIAGMLFAYAAIMLSIALMAFFKLLPAAQDTYNETLFGMFGDFSRLNDLHLEVIARNPKPGELYKTEDGAIELTSVRSSAQN